MRPRQLSHCHHSCRNSQMYLTDVPAGTHRCTCRFRECNPLSFKIRTKRYLTRKIKKANDAGPAMFAPVGGQCYMKGDGSGRLSHTAINVPSLKAHLEANPDRFFLIVAWMIPGEPQYQAACCLLTSTASSVSTFSACRTSRIHCLTLSTSP